MDFFDFEIHIKKSVISKPYTMKKPTKKPTGDIRILKVSFDGTNTLQNNIDMQFPNNKEEMEKLVVDLFLKSWKRMFKNNPPKLVEQNKQYDLDFTLQDPSGIFYLELTELVPFKMGSNGFSSVTDEIDQNVLMENLTSIIKTKSEKYSSIEGAIDLLVYYTDDRADFGMVATHWIQIWLNTNKHRFRNIFFFKPLPQLKNGHGMLLFPNPNQRTELPELNSVIYLGVKPKQK